MRKFLILACAAVLLLQVSCGGSGDGTSSPAEKKGQIADISVKPKAWKSRWPGANKKTPTASPVAPKKAKKKIVPDPAREFFVSPDVFGSPDKGLGGGVDAAAKKAGFPGFPGVGKEKQPPPIPPKAKKDKTKGVKKGFKVKQIKNPPVTPGGMKNRPDPSVYLVRGKTIEEWIKEIPSQDRSRSERAMRAVLLFGPERSQQAAAAILAVLKTHTTRRPLDASLRVNGVIGLGTILAEENKPDARVVKAAVPVLTRMLRDSQVLVKYRTCQALERIGPAAAYAIPELAKRVYDPATWEVRQAAALALGRVAYREKLGPENAVLNALYGPLKVDKARLVRLAAIQSLVFLGPPKLQANRVVLRKHIAEVAYQDPDETVQIWAHMAVMSIEGKPDPDRVRMIATKIASDELPVRVQAVRALWATGIDAKTEIPSLIAALDDREQEVVYWAMAALSEMGRHPQDAVARLQQIAKDKNMPPFMKAMATHTINSIQGKVTKKMEKK